MAFSVADYRRGLRDVTPMMFGVAPFGMITGVSAASVGVAPHEALGMSMLIFAGASQLAGLALLGQGAGIVVIVLTTFMINLRMAMYSASLAPWLRELKGRTRLLLAYLLTDHAYAFAILHYRRAEPPPGSRRDYFLGVGTSLWLLWMLTTLLGAVLGAQVPPEWGLDFAIPLTFLALLMPTVRDRPSLVAAVVGGGLALLGRDLPFNLGLVGGALAGIAAGALAEAALGGGADAPPEEAAE